LDQDVKLLEQNKVKLNRESLAALGDEDSVIYYNLNNLTHELVQRKKELFNRQKLIRTLVDGQGLNCPFSKITAKQTHGKREDLGEQAEASVAAAL